MNIKKYIPKFVFTVWHFGLAILGALVYRFPSKKIKVIGITGTNGKSTTANICTSVLEAGGLKVAQLSSIVFKIGEEERVNNLKMTMPGRLKIQKFLREAVDKKCDVVILEVTSEGIEQFRHKFIDFEIGVFTNLSPEHIESHGGFENYKKAKGKFFNIPKKVHVLNGDDEYFEYFNSFNVEKKITYSINSDSDFKAVDFDLREDGSLFKVNNIEYKTNLLGKFNIYNCLVGIAIGNYYGISEDKIQEGIKNVKGVPGRMEEVISEPFKFFIDYAFTPFALEKVYQYLHPDIAILGACGGGRDKWKRKVLGELANKYARTVIITNEDPYDEDPMSIINEVALNVENPIKILDRREAIKKALELINDKEVIVITGKGSETCIMHKNGKREDWSERQVILEEYKKKA
jgi:UDP-N-acetylmuramoyl-L-alanyl-D-glutamate--2,6-diaminopimelate ligase